MTDNQERMLSVMPLGVPMKAYEVVTAGGAVKSSTVGAMAVGLEKLGYLTMQRRGSDGRPTSYTKVRDLPPPPAPSKRAIEARRDFGGGINRVSLPIEPWSSA